MQTLYETAIQLMDQVEGIKDSIKDLANEGTGRILLRVDGGCRYVNVRPSAYSQFLNGELKSLQKDLKLIEAEIKRKIN